MSYFKDIFASKLSEQIKDLTKEELLELIESPDAKMGDLAFPCFKLAKIFRKAPHVISQELVEKLNFNNEFSSVKAVGPYINVFINNSALLKHFENEFTNNKILQPLPRLNKNIPIDYSSPNIAKPIAFHHIRSTVIGNAISNLFEFIGYDLKRINYLGDWGTQFGKLSVAFKKWGNEKDLEEKGIKHLLEIYVKYHEESKNDETLDIEARRLFKLTEDGDEEALKLWKRFRDISIKEFNRIYDILGVKFTHIEGESRYASTLNDTIELIKTKIHTEISQGALIIPLEEEDMPPVLLKKMDGATLYATRDIAAAIDRYERFNSARSLYAVGSQQKLYFKQLKTVLLKMGYEWAENIKHIDFGMVKGMSTRKGNLVFLEDVLKEAIALSKEKILEKGRVPESEIDEVARKVGVGAIIFGDLKSSRINDFEFNWEDLLNFSGYSGPYVQYSYTRVKSIMRKSDIKDYSNADLSLLKEDIEIELVKELLKFPQIIQKAVDNDELYFLAKYSYSLSKLMANFHRFVHVLNADTETQKARLFLLSKVADTIKTTLSILGVETVESM